MNALSGSCVGKPVWWAGVSQVNRWREDACAGDSKAQKEIVFVPREASVPPTQGLKGRQDTVPSSGTKKKMEEKRRKEAV